MEQPQLELDFQDLVVEVVKITKRKPRKTKEARLLEFKRVLNQEAPKKLIKTNREFGNKFIPLQVVEQMLLAMFDAYEVVIPFPPVLMEGQVITVVNLIVHHPVLKIPLTYSGESCVPLIAAESTQMVWNHRNIPGGKGFAILNASKEISQIFRAEKDEYSDIMRDYFEKKKEEVVKDPAEFEMKKRLLQMIDHSKTLESLKLKFDKIEDVADGELTRAYRLKYNELINKK